MDEIDRSQDYQAREIANILAQRSRPAGESSMTCAECERPIPEKRRIAYPGCRLCIECARDAEAESARGR